MTDETLMPRMCDTGWPPVLWYQEASCITHKTMQHSDNVIRPQMALVSKSLEPDKSFGHHTQTHKSPLLLIDTCKHGHPALDFINRHWLIMANILLQVSRLCAGQDKSGDSWLTSPHAYLQLGAIKVLDVFSQKLVQDIRDYFRKHFESSLTSNQCAMLNVSRITRTTTATTMSSTSLCTTDGQTVSVCVYHNRSLPQQSSHHMT